MSTDKDKDMEASLKAASLKAVTPPRKAGIANVAAASAPGAHRPASIKAVEVADTFDRDVAVRFAFLGAGQGGGRIAQSFWDIGYRRVGAFNTTSDDFAGLVPDMPKLSLDTGGAAKDMARARSALAGRDEEVRDLMTRAWGTKIDCAIVCVGLGGGSGSGTALPLVEAARRYMTDCGSSPRVGAIVALPGAGDGQKVASNALIAFRELQAAGVSPLIVIDNDKVHDLYDHPPMGRLLALANSLVSQLLHLFNQLAAARSPHVTFDRSEFVQLLDSGLVVMGSADFAVEDIKSPADVSERIKDQLAASVLADVDFRTGSKAACIFVAADSVLDTFSRDYFAAGFTMLNRIVGSSRQVGTDIVVHRGLYPNGESGLQCYTMVADLLPPDKKLQALAREAGMAAAQPATTGGAAKHLKVD